MIFLKPDSKKKTSAKVEDLLEEFGLKVHRGIGRTGVVEVMQCGHGSKSIGLRTDMDALPINGTNYFDHRSHHDGTMQPCGLDGHTT